VCAAWPLWLCLPGARPRVSAAAIVSQRPHDVLRKPDSHGAEGQQGRQNARC
jgi:hypothetical protein